jgi:hypothetical protein
MLSSSNGGTNTAASRLARAALRALRHLADLTVLSHRRSVIFLHAFLLQGRTKVYQERMTRLVRLALLALGHFADLAVFGHSGFVIFLHGFLLWLGVTRLAKVLYQRYGFGGQGQPGHAV